MKRLVSLLTVDDILQLNGNFLLFNSKTIKAVTIYQENTKIVIGGIGSEIEINRDNIASSLEKFKLKYKGYAIISQFDLFIILAKV